MAWPFFAVNVITPTPPHHTDVGAIVGGSVGGGVFLLILMVMLAIYVYRTRDPDHHFVRLTDADIQDIEGEQSTCMCRPVSARDLITMSS